MEFQLANDGKMIYRMLDYYAMLYRKDEIPVRQHVIYIGEGLEMGMDNLRTQLSPHFTFNIFNNLQFLIRKDKDEALELLARYSKILRYYVYEAQNKWIKLDDEVDFLKHYVQLEKDRSGEYLQIDCHWNVTRSQLMIPPFLLSTFVENAFKHVSVLADQHNYSNIDISLQNENELILTMENSTDPSANKSKGDGFGLTSLSPPLYEPLRVTFL